MKKPNINWIYELKKEVPLFLKKLERKNGFHHYSLSSDILGEQFHWGLGNAVFALKIYYTLNLLDEVNTDKITAYILSFQNKKGFIFDPYIRVLSIPSRYLNFIRSLKFNTISYSQTKYAETRQAISSLKLVSVQPHYEFNKFPSTELEIDTFLNDLNWSKPWNAGSHFSHLMFFLENSSLKNKKKLINHSIKWISKMEQQDGSWYMGETSLQEKINGAMKVITGFNTASCMAIKRPKELIDLCLNAKNDSHACDNFNIIYVLKYASEEVNYSYRYDEIKDFCYDRLDIYKQFYYPQIGGFSFLPQKANTLYYGAPVTYGRNEPDIHGTVMFLWGISIIAQILKINDRLQFNEFIT